MDLSEKLAKLKTVNGLTTDMLAALSDVPKGTINKILNGETRNPTSRTLSQLARALRCRPEDLLSGGGGEGIARELREDPIPNYDGILPISTRRVPLPGFDAGGFTAGSDEERALFSGPEAISACDYALRAEDDGMVGARILRGDIVFLRTQSDVDDGQIAAVSVEGKVSLKRVYHVRDGVTLVSENSDFPPMVFTGKDFRDVRILGRAVCFQSRL